MQNSCKIYVKSDLKSDCNSSALSGFTFQMQLRIMILGRMLDNGKSQTGTAGLLGMAFIHPVEPFKDPALMLCRNADARIPDAKGGVVSGRDRHSDSTAGYIIFNSIFAKIINDLIQQPPDALPDNRLALYQ